MLNLRSFAAALPRGARTVWSCLLLAVLPLVASVAREKEFKISAGDAAVTLREFARQSGEQIIYLGDRVRGVGTQPIAGRMETFEALQRMLVGSGLIARRESTGAMTVAREGERAAAATPRSKSERRAAEAAPADTIVTMTEFTVSSTAVDRYRAADAVSAVRVRAALLDTPSSVSVMTRDVLDDLVPTRIFDVTRYIAGVEEGRGIQFSDRQIIRGFESNGRTVDNFLQTGADNFDEAVIERIEVSKGPNAILAPAGVPGGSINVITKSPRFVPRRTFTGLVGLFDAQKGTVDLTGPIEHAGAPLAYRVVGAVQDSRRYWASDARLRGKVFAPMLTWAPSADTQLTLKVIAAEHWIFREPGLILDPGVSYETDPPVLAPGFSFKSRNGIQPWSHVGTHSADVFALLTSHLSEAVSLRVAANGRYYFEDSTQEFFSTPTFNNRYEPTSGRLTQDYTWDFDPATGGYVARHARFFEPTSIPVRGDTQSTTVTTTNFQADVAVTRHLGGVRSQTVAGVALSHFDNVGRSRSGTLPPLNLTRTDLLAQPVWSPTLYLDLRSKQNTQQLYLNERVSFLSERVQLTAGALYYGVYAKSHNRASPEAVVNVLDDSRSLWLASVLLKPGRNVSVYYTRSTNSTPVIANELPLWRDGRQDEIGVKSEFLGQRLAFNVAWFRIKQTNVSVPNPDHQTDPEAPEMLISDLRDRGWEFELTGGVTANLSVIASYTELRLRDSLGRRVRAVADRNAGVLLNYRFGSGGLRGLSTFLGMSHAGERPGDATAVNFTPLGVPTQQSFRIPAYWTTNIGAAYKAGRVVVRLNVDNFLNDKNYLQLAGGRVSGTGLTSATGLNVKVSTTVEF